MMRRYRMCAAAAFTSEVGNGRAGCCSTSSKIEEGRAAPSPGNARDLSLGRVPHGGTLKRCGSIRQIRALMLARTCHKIVL